MEKLGIVWYFIVLILLGAALYIVDLLPINPIIKRIIQVLSIVIAAIYILIGLAEWLHSVN